MEIFKKKSIVKNSNNLKNNSIIILRVNKQIIKINMLCKIITKIIYLIIM